MENDFLAKDKIFPTAKKPFSQANMYFSSLGNGILFDYFVGKRMTQTISLLKSCFPYY